MNESSSSESQAPSTRAKNWRGGRLACILGLVLIAGTLVCYWPAGHFGFVLYEDPLTVSENLMVQQGLTWPSFLWAFKSVVTCNWQPLTSLSHMLDCQLLGPEAGNHHLISVLIHAINVLLLFVVLKRMTGAVWRSAFVAALFGWHPMNVESVAWLSERKNVLSGLFFLLTLWAYARYVQAEVRSPKSASRITHHASFWYLLALGFFALGLMSKPMLVTLPFVLLLLDVWPLRRFAWPGLLSSTNATVSDAAAPPHSPSLASPLWLVLEKLPFFALTVANCIITFWAQKKYGSLPSLDMFPLSLRLENALTSYAVYLGKLFWPGEMAVFYPYPHSIPLWQAAGAGVLLCVVSAAVVWRIRKHPCLAVGWFWFIGMLVPTIGLVQTGLQSRGDHHTYLPYIGLGLALAWGVPALLEGLVGRCGGATEGAKKQETAERTQGFGRLGVVLGVVAVAVLGGCWVGARAQLGYWQDSVTLLRHTVQVTSQNEAAGNMLGIALWQKGKLEEAASQFQEALRLYPEGSRFRHQYFKNLGMIYLQQHDSDKAVEMFSETLKLKPDSAVARLNLGFAYGSKGQMDQCAAQLQRVADMVPGNDVELNDSELQKRLARGLIRCGKSEEALKHCQDLVAAHPEDAAFRSILAGVYTSLNRSEDAILSLREAICRAPKMAVYLNQLARILATSPEARLRNGAEAIGLAERACAVTRRRNAGYLDTLSAAYAEAGRFPEAISTAQEALTAALASRDQKGADMISQKLELYRAGQPYHESAAERGNGSGGRASQQRTN